MGYLQMAILAATLAAGVGLGYTFEHSQVLMMEGKIKDQKIEAASLLASETLKVSKAEQAQRNLNTELDKSRESLISTSNAYSLKQYALINSLQFTDSGKSGSSPSDSNTSPFINPTDDSQFTWVSKKLLKYLAGESVRAEQDGIDKNTLLTFVLDQNCGVPR
jgi:hypothetical protein